MTRSSSGRLAVNTSARRWRVTGADLLPRFAPGPVDAFGIDADRLPGALGEAGRHVRFAGNVAPEELYAALARRRVYLHLNRWTSLGLSLLQAMHLGMPVVVLGTTEAWRAVPPGAGVISSNVADLVRTARRLLANPAEAAERGLAARAAVVERYGDEVFAGAARL
jgi:glycosyltransferase involved in cell wall biosynthesis